MKRRKIDFKWGIPLVVLIILISITATEKQNIPAPLDLDGFKKKEFTTKDLSEWELHGLGVAFDAGTGQFCLKENDSTLGVTLISPQYYKGDIVVRYKTMALTSASVLVVMLHASDLKSTNQLSIPDDYNGNMGMWVNEKSNYFFAFRNEPHNYTPFIRKYPIPGNNALTAAEKNIMLPGKYYSIEIGKIDNELWLAIDGEKVVKTTDSKELAGGHLIFRIRGTASLKAACLIKELEIYNK